MGLGVDFGTSYSAAAVFGSGRARPVELEYDRTVAPSALFLKEDGTFVFGQDAQLAGAAAPERLMLDIKAEFSRTEAYFVGGARVSLVAALAAILSEIRTRVIAQVPDFDPTSPVTFTVPATYSAKDPDCALYRKAANDAGFDPARIHFLAEPIAAATSFLSGQWQQATLPANSALLVYDLGGGTFDGAAVRDGVNGLKVIGVPIGDPAIGGTRFDRLILDAALERAPAETRDLYRRPADPAALADWRARIMAALQICRNVKESLGALGRAQIRLPGLPEPVMLTSGALDDLLAPLIETTAAHLDRLASEARETGVEVAAILLVGGSCRLRLVPELLERRFGLELIKAPDPARIVATGAAIDAARRGRVTPPAPEQSRIAGKRSGKDAFGNPAGSLNDGGGRK